MRKVRVSLQEVSISNDWLFNRIMSDPELCKLFLEKVLKIKIREVKFINSQHTIDSRVNSKGIRLDVYVEDENNTVYTIEMQCQNRDLPRRSRYYQSNIDTDHLQKGESYKSLNNSLIIFICTFDLFGQGRHFYSFRNLCEQDNGLQLKDGTCKIFLNTKGFLDDVDEEIKEFLNYAESSTEQVASACSGELVREIHKKVESIRKNAESEVEFMTYMDKLSEVMEDAREDGLEEGRREGRQEGRREGRQEGRQEGREEGREEGKIEVAEKMLCAGIAVDDIICFTGFTNEKIEEIQKKMSRKT